MLSCEVCNSENLKYRDIGDIHYNIPGTFRYTFCEDCGFNHIENVDMDMLAEFYEKVDYYAYSKVKSSKLIANLLNRLVNRNKYKFQQSLIIILIKFLSRGRFWWLSREDYTGKSFLDIGCGAGQLLTYVASLGMKPFGTDVSTTGLDTVHHKGYPVFQGDCAQIDFYGKKFDIIHSNHAIEHMNDIQSVFAQLRKISHGKSKIFIRVPNPRSKSAADMQSWYYFGAPVHLNHITKSSVEILAKRHGFKVCDVSEFWDESELLYIFIRQVLKLPKDIADRFLNNKFALLLMVPIRSFLNQFLPGSNLEIVLEIDT